VTTTYQWLRDGGTIYAADQPTYTLSLDDYGKDISLKVTGKRASYADGTSVSNTVRVTAGGALTATSQPRITGTPAPGQTLNVENGSWTQPGATFSFQWMRTGAPIPQATGGSYQLTPSDAGKDLSVVVFAKKNGYSDGSATAPAVAVSKLTSTTAFTMSTTRTSRKKKIAFGITVAVPGVEAPSGVVRIMDGVKTLKTLTMDPFRKGVLKTKLKVKKKGRHKIKVVYVGNATTGGSAAKTQRLIITK
jgi:hypothetical protein